MTTNELNDITTTLLTNVRYEDEDKEDEATLNRAKGLLPEDMLIPPTPGAQDDGVVNVFCPTGEGGGVDPTCGPGGEKAGDHPPPTTKAKEERGKARLESLKREAQSVEVTDRVVKGASIGRDDLGEIESHLDHRERTKLEDYLSQMQESYVDYQMEYYDPSDYIDHRELVYEAGWARSDVAEKAEDLLKTHLGANHEDIDDLTGDIEKWQASTKSYGPDAVESLARHLDREGWDAETVGQLDELKDEAEKDIEERLKAYIEDLKRVRRRELEDEYDRDDDRRDWLREFYDDHEERFSGERTEDVWGVNHDGDRTYLFSTSAGNSYDIWVTPAAFNGQKVLEVGFNDASGSHKVTGAGGAHEVFTTVTTAVTALVLKESPPVLSFTAAEPSRQKLYDRLVRTTAAAAPRYAAVAIPLPDGGRRYVLIVRDDLGRIKDMIPRGVSAPETLVNRHHDPRGHK